MPYIENEYRPHLDPHINRLLLHYNLGDYKHEDISVAVADLCYAIRNEGDFNYTISKIIWTIFETTKRYAVANELIDILDEVYLRIVGIGVPESELGSIILEIAQRLLNYSDVKGIRGALRCIELEFYRRKVAPYEDTKINDAKNGDLKLW